MSYIRHLSLKSKLRFWIFSFLSLSKRILEPIFLQQPISLYHSIWELTKGALIDTDKRCKEWLRRHAPEHFPDIFPDEAAARLAALRLAEETGAQAEPDDGSDDGVKVAIPIEQKTSGGKKKKTPAEVILMLGKRKGWKHVTIVYGLDLFGIKLKDAAKAAKRKFATGSSVTVVCVPYPTMSHSNFNSQALKPHADEIYIRLYFIVCR